MPRSPATQRPPADSARANPAAASNGLVAKRLGQWAAKAGWVRRSESDARWSALFESASDGMLLCDDKGTVLAANAAAAGLVAQVPSAMCGQPLLRWVEQSVDKTRRPAEGRFPALTGEAALRQAHGPSRSVELRLTALPRDTAAAVGEADSGVQWLVVLRDNTDRRKTQERLNFLANFDSLTGLPNRALFRDRLAQAMARAQRSGKTMALMFMDLDRFKLVNDGLGHEVGDSLLKHVAQTLTNSLRDVDSVSRQIECEPCVLSRLGGDEFTVIAEDIGGAEDATHIARRLLDALQVPIQMGDEEVVISASIGISLFPTDDVDLDGLIKHTDMAMYRSKSMGRGTYSFFSDELNAAMSARLSLEGSLRRAVERQEFLLYFQPKADLRTGRVTGVEALLRWQCPRQGLVPPDRFIGVLEDTGMILPVGAWVIRTACQQLAEWDRMGLPKLRMAVNLSARQFRHLYLASMIQDTLSENGLDATRLEIELTESLLMEDSESNRNMLDSFSRMGVRLAIDDFGTGHSSLSYLKRFNIDTLKVDRSFVSSLPDSGEDKAIANAVIALAHSLEMSVVAEGVETHAQAKMLRDMGCDEIQGYLLSRPLPAAALAEWLTLRTREEQQRKLSLGGPGDGLQKMKLSLAAEG
jgi:diguanylate cyclase (GGDEF)-like protein/PAS domain S-box-containing protein